MNPDDFEQKLRRQPIRPVPADWREEILRAADAVAGLRPSTRDVRPAGFLSTLNSRLSAILWPSPVAWAGLAAIWIFVFAVDFSLRDNPPARAEKPSPPSPEIMVELRQQQRLLAELAGLNQMHDSDRQKMFVPAPRSEQAQILTV